MDAIARKMPLPLYWEWRAFAKMHPLLFSPDYAQARHDWNAGMVAATFATSMSSFWAKYPRIYHTSDLMYDASREPQNTAPKKAKDIYIMLRTALLLRVPDKT